MYSGEDSSGDALSNKNLVTSWPLSQSTCNMNNKDQIDWAALAQQWIQMKESCSSVPETEENHNNAAINNSEEQGEAPMEVVKDDEVPSGQNALCSLGVPFPNNLRDWSASWYSGNPTQFCSSWNEWSTNNGGGVQIPPVQPLNFFKNSNSTIPLLKSNNETPTTVVDVAKKKTLPAWIREGLEKMEREKQKQMEKMRRSSGGEKSDFVKEGTSARSILRDIDEDHEDSNSDNNEKVEDKAILRVSQEAQKRNREEIMEELMLVVRKSLTELLLEVTNEEIINISQETLRKYKTKASSAQVFRKSAISSITGKLGLGAYADSASEESESESNHSVEETDSEEEIKENIRIRQNAFKTIAQEIELAIQQSEEKEQKAGKEVDNNSEEPLEASSQRGYTKDSGETQPDKKSQSDGKRSKERTSRFSAIKDSKQKSNSYIVQATAIPCTSYEHDRRKTTKTSSRRRSYTSDSSSNSSDTYKKSRRRTKTKDEKRWRTDNRYDSSRASSDSDDHYKKRKYHKSHSGDRDRSTSRSRSRSRSRSHSYSSKRSEKRY